MVTLLEMFIVFFIATPIGFLLLVSLLIISEYFILKAIIRDMRALVNKLPVGNLKISMQKLLWYGKWLDGIIVHTMQIIQSTIRLKSIMIYHKLPYVSKIKI